MKIRVGQFMSFCAADGAARIGVVRSAQEAMRNGYVPAHDYWKPMRDAVRRVVRDGEPLGALRALPPTLRDPRKQANYEAAVTGILKWVGRKKIICVAVPSLPWTSGDLTVQVNPEFGVRLDGELYVVKLHCKVGPKLVKRRVDPILRLLELTHATRVDGANVGILDARNSNLIVPTRRVPGIDALLHGEAAAFARMWQELDEGQAAA